MTLIQIEAAAIALGMLALFAWDRWRYDVVACAALLAALATGVVHSDRAFSGFSSPVIVIIGSVLIVSRAIARSRILDIPVQRALRRATTTGAQIGLLAGCVALMSAIVKNVGTLGIFIPIAIQTARRSGRSPSAYLMPLSFASLTGGAITLVGTSPNLLISDIRAKQTGAPFAMFDFAWVGLPLTALAVAFLSFGWRLLPRDRKGRPSEEERFDVGRYATELVVAPSSAAVGRTVGHVEDAVEGDLIVTAVMREPGGRHSVPSRNWRLAENDVLSVQASPDVVKAVVASQGLALAARREIAGADETPDDMVAVEAIVGPDSPLIGATAASLRLRQRHEVNLLAVSGRAGAPRGRLRDHPFAAGDVIVLQGMEANVATTLAELGCLPLADRNLELHRAERGYLPLVVLAAALALMLLHVASVEAAFFGAAVVIVAANQITLKNAYAAIEGPVIVMLAALLPIGEALKETGVTQLIAAQLTGVAAQMPGGLALGFVLAVSMLVTPVMHHAPAVLVMGPIAGEMAKALGYRPDAFFMAVALGAACDFLSPIGHQNNLLVKEPGGYRFGDYWRLGLPLSIMVLLAGTPLILWAWPIR